MFQAPTDVSPLQVVSSDGVAARRAYTERHARSMPSIRRMMYGKRVMVCHEHKRSQQAVGVRNCLIDEGGPLGIGLQELVPNHLRRLWSKAKVVNAEGKGP